nr:MAG: hypothetical protein [Molluscum contagiosum virus]
MTARHRAHDKHVNPDHDSGYQHGDFAREILQAGRRMQHGAL